MTEEVGRPLAVGVGGAEFGERVIPKSSLSNHFKVLRESGLIVSERQGVEMLNQTRCAELDERFPGLIKAILTAYGELPGQPKAD